jgi:Holliday junction resolvase-like predicted endonuclease
MPAGALEMRELDQLRFVDMPWIPADHPAVMIYPRQQPNAIDFDRLCALGIDAFRIGLELLQPDGARRRRRRIRLTRDQQFVRELTAALFVDGKIVSRRPADEPPRRARRGPSSCIPATAGLKLVRTQLYRFGEIDLRARRLNARVRRGAYAHSDVFGGAAASITAGKRRNWCARRASYGSCAIVHPLDVDALLISGTRHSVEWIKDAFGE